MKWIKDNAGLFGLGILLSGVFLYGLNTQQKMMDIRFDVVDTRFEAVDTRFEAVEVRFQAIEKDLQAVKTDIRRLEVQINRLDNKINQLDNKINQLIISLVGKDKAAVIKRQAEELFADTRPVALLPAGQDKQNKKNTQRQRNIAEDVSSESPPAISENKQAQTK